MGDRRTFFCAFTGGAGVLSEKGGAVTGVVLRGVFSLWRKLKAREGKGVIKDKAAITATLSR